MLRWQNAKRCARRRKIIDELLGSGRRDTDRRDNVRRGRNRIACRVEVFAKPRHRLRQLRAAARRFTEPERNRRWLSVRVFDADTPAFDAHDSI